MGPLPMQTLEDAPPQDRKGAEASKGDGGAKGKDSKKEPDAPRHEHTHLEVPLEHLCKLACALMGEAEVLSVLVACEELPMYDGAPRRFLPGTWVRLPSPPRRRPMTQRLRSRFGSVRPGGPKSWRTQWPLAALAFEAPFNCRCLMTCPRALTRGCM